MKVAVLGAGLQGSCIALELASRGVKVALYDQNAACMTQASSQNEGKIHLGYVYANDPSRNSARAMIEGAVRFQPLLRRLLGDMELPVSTPFYYLVHSDSLLSIPQVEAHFRDCGKMARDIAGEGTPEYFGRDYRLTPERLTDAECAALFDPDLVQAAYRTEEVSIDPEFLAQRVHVAVTENPRITCHWNTHIDGVTPREDSAIVNGDAPYDHVINTLWEGRLAVDQTAGITPSLPWLYRVKHYLRVQLLPSETVGIPSSTIVLGAFGDVVNYNNGALYLSWYPTGMLGASTAIRPPAWPPPSGELQSNLRASIFQELSRIVPSLKRLSPACIENAHVKGGVIFAWGSTDIDDPHSGLHDRYRIGPVSYGRYHSVDTGKLTMAPFFAQTLAQQIA
ncbi:MAG: FAD-dependent oxidoreductase [Chthoniobacterales bacterium]